jgi:hypothetical protein
MHLAVADISIVPFFADRITSGQGLGGKADIAIALQNVR